MVRVRSRVAGRVRVRVRCAPVRSRVRGQFRVRVRVRVRIEQVENWNSDHGRSSTCARARNLRIFKKVASTSVA